MRWEKSQFTGDFKPTTFSFQTNSPVLWSPCHHFCHNLTKFFVFSYAGPTFLAAKEAWASWASLSWATWLTPSRRTTASTWRTTATPSEASSSSMARASSGRSPWTTSQLEGEQHLCMENLPGSKTLALNQPNGIILIGAKRKNDPRLAKDSFCAEIFFLAVQLSGS